MRASAERKRVSRTAELDIVDAFVAQGRTLTRDPEKWVPVFGKDYAQSENLERDDDAQRNHPAPGRMSCKTNAKHDNAGADLRARSQVFGCAAFADGSSHDQSRARHHRRLRHLRPAG